MKDREVFRPILTKGEEYNEPAEPARSGPREDKRLTYNQVKANIIKNIELIESEIQQISDEYLMENIVVNLKMRLDRSSKSDHPSTLIREVNFMQVGTRKWSAEVENKKHETELKIGKDIFVLTSKNGLNDLKNTLSKDLLTNSSKDAIRNVEELYIDDHSTILRSFNEKWKQGRIEVILHPYLNDDELLKKFYDLVSSNNGNTNTMKIRRYEKGPIFISMSADKLLVEKIKPFNLLRAMHPLRLKSFNDELICESSDTVPPVSSNSFIPEVTIGIFDGGITSNHPILNRYVIENNLTKEEKDEECINHGNAVVSAALFGDLKDIKSSTLPVPSIRVESFRVLPLEDKNDELDLYEIIDHIEKVAKDRPDIKVYNLSLGPDGPIEDDVISRFTYSLDRLSKNGKRIYTIAAGNDGDLRNDLGRIQAPSDSVNNLAVGSYTYNGQEIMRAPYSCYGDGREGSKVKPDVVEYGGDDNRRMHFISSSGYNKLYGCGTSFSAPIVARKLAEIVGYTSIESPLTAKAVLIHTSTNPNDKPDKYLGNGIVKNDYLDILECSQNKVTVIYESTLLKAKRAILKIPFIKNLNFKGKVKISWTICIATNVDSSDSDDYTNMCIEDTFYPNSYKYQLKHPIKKNVTKTVHLIKDKEIMDELIDIGWTKPSMPKSRSNADSKYKTEQQRRADFKWDTVVKRHSGNMEYSSVEDPYIIIHALSRDKVKYAKEDRLTYSAVVTVEYIKCPYDTYSETVKQYSRLEQATITNINELIVSNK